MTKQLRRRVSVPSTALLGTAEDRIPIFAVTASGNFKTFPKKGSENDRGCHLSFVCPKCGKKNMHGGTYGEPGTCDGHRASHCECWPLGYYIREVPNEKVRV